MSSIHIEQVTKIYPDGTNAVSAIDLPIEDGQFAVLVGPSGCGKTTLLRMVAGLEQISSGVIRIGDRDVSEVPARDRDIAMVFQNYALYPHMNVFDNMAFALRRRKMERAEIDSRVNRAADALGITSQLKKKPRALSGGQRQRVAMGRAIVREPQAFLMDEPLSNLDAKLRAQTRAEIARLQSELGVTTIYVTHDQVEAMTLGHVVAVMNHGKLQQLASPDTLYKAPCNLFVAGFIGSPPMNLVQARIIETAGDVKAVFGDHELTIPESTVLRLPQIRAYVGECLVVGIRPEDIYEAGVDRDAEGSVGHLKVLIDLRESLGPVADLHFAVGTAPVPVAAYGVGATGEAAQQSVGSGTLGAGTDAEVRGKWDESTRLIARVNASDRTSRAGETARLGVRLERLYFFDPASGEALTATGAASAYVQQPVVSR